MAATDRRRAKRVQPGPLTVSLYEQDGVLVDISESGACFRVRSAQASDALLAFILRWEQESILLRGRVVRSRVYRARSEAKLVRLEHDIGVEFYQLPPHSTSQLQRLTASVPDTL